MDQYELLDLGVKEYEKQTKEGFLKAIDYYQQSANLGNGQAMCNLGYCFYYGRGVEVDKRRGFDYFMDAANAGCVEGTMKVADFYRYGEFVDKDEEIAFDCYYRIYKYLLLEDLDAMFPEILLRLGECYLKGIGTDKNIDSAEFYLSDAKRFYESILEQSFYYQKQLKKVNQLLQECKKV